MKQVVISVDITPLMGMFGNRIIVGEDVNRLLLDNLSLPNVNKTLDIFFTKYDIGITDDEQLFHFLTVMKKVLLRSAPVERRTILSSVDILNTNKVGSSLLMEISYNYE